MICRFMGEPNCNSFRREWVPLMYVITVKGRIANFANIIAMNLLMAVNKFRGDSHDKASTFYMAAFMMDVICASVTFPGLKMTWSPNDALVPEFYQMLWIDRYALYFYAICNEIMPHLFFLLYGHLPTRISPEGQSTIWEIGCWYVTDYCTYI